MSYSVEFSRQAKNDLKKLDRNIALLLIGWLDKNLTDCENPRLFGKALVGGLKGLWRYRIGDYRVIAEIQDTKLVILALRIGHRRDIYKK